MVSWVPYDINIKLPNLTVHAITTDGKSTLSQIRQTWKYLETLDMLLEMDLMYLVV